MNELPGVSSSASFSGSTLAEASARSIPSRAVAAESNWLTIKVSLASMLNVLRVLVRKAACRAACCRTDLLLSSSLSSSASGFPEWASVHLAAAFPHRQWLSFYG
jgi:hypothetical protein